MAFNKTKPQDYTPIRLSKSQVGPFFDLLKDRKLSKGDQVSSFKVTNRPLTGAPSKERDIGISGTAPKASKSGSSKTSTQTVTKGRRGEKRKAQQPKSTKKTSSKPKRSRIEKHIKKAKL